MPLEVIDLLSSDDEDQSPNKAAQSALQNFGPRKERNPGDNGITDRAARESFPVRRFDEEEENAGSVLSAFQPRKERKDTKESLSSDFGARRLSTGDAQHPRGKQPSSAVSKVPPATYSHATGGPLRTIVGQSTGVESQNRNGSGLNGIHGVGDYRATAQPNFTAEEGSLAALLQQSQSTKSREAFAPAKRPGKRISDGRSDGARPLPGPISKSPGDTSAHPPRFKYPSGLSPIKQQELRREAPLKIVDSNEDVLHRPFIKEADISDIRPFKRPRLSLPEQSRDTPAAKEFPRTCKHDLPTPAEVRSGSTAVNGRSFPDPSNSSTRTPVEQATIQSATSRPPERNTESLDPTQVNLIPPVEEAPVRSEQVGSIENGTNSPFTASSGECSPSRRSATTTEAVPSVKHADRAEGLSHTTSPSTARNVHPKSGTPTSFGNQYTPEEDALLAELKEVRNMRWDDMLPYFHGRTKGSLQVRYSTKVSKRNKHPKKALSKPQKGSPLVHEEDGSDSATAYEAPARRRKKRNNEASAVSGMVSWAEVGRRKHMVDDAASLSEPSAPSTTRSKRSPQFDQERAQPRSASRIIRQRELGGSARCGPVSLPDELKEHVFDDVGPLKYHKGTSGDVTCLAWSADGVHFAAGSIAISDERSMQYNRPGNLILGDYAQSRLQELPEHHIARPAITATDNVNGLHAMRESQDPRLFMTVANIQFSPDGKTLYSGGTDSKARAYDISSREASCSYAIGHAAPLDLLSAGNLNILATACHQSENGSIGIYREGQHMMSLSPSRIDQQTSRAIYPSALRWGSSHHHSNLLLAGFSIDSIDAERDIAGETCLWDIAHEKRIPMPVTRNVFDVAWNPRPTSTSTVFAVASTPGTQKVSKGTRTVVQCFAPNQGRASRVLEWESPAFDINDVVYCQHDDNLIAAGATDGKVYVWDQRFAGRRPTPLHVLEHGGSLNVLDHDREREVADTGVRFLSWGATSSRLYTGSSDGVVKIWNPYMSTENAHIKNVATFETAIMSGAFSPDYRDLLIGEDQGQINSLSIGHGEKSVKSMRRFDFVPAPLPEAQEDRYDVAHELLRSQQIVQRPMGDLPKRQAVRGPEYRGPFQAPSAADMQNAQLAFNTALENQYAAHSHTSIEDMAETSIQQAEERVQQAEKHLADLQKRLNADATLQLDAEANQLRLHQAERQRLKLEASLSHALEGCKLDCNYLPADVDDDGKVADSGRSESRRPGNLRALPAQDSASLTPEEAMEARLMNKCTRCTAPATTPKVGQPLCAFCAAAKRGLTAKCVKCSAPVRLQTETTTENLCEKCNFACFRCGGKSEVAQDCSQIWCPECDLIWNVGVLGYELVGQIPCKLSERERGSRDHEFGEAEMERLAALWGSCC